MSVGTASDETKPVAPPGTSEAVAVVTAVSTHTGGDANTVSWVAGPVAASSTTAVGDVAVPGVAVITTVAPDGTDPVAMGVLVEAATYDGTEAAGPVADKPRGTTDELCGVVPATVREPGAVGGAAGAMLSGVATAGVAVGRITTARADGAASPTAVSAATGTSIVAQGAAVGDVVAAAVDVSATPAGVDVPAVDATNTVTGVVISAVDDSARSITVRADGTPSSKTCACVAGTGADPVVRGGHVADVPRRAATGGWDGCRPPRDACPGGNAIPPSRPRTAVSCARASLADARTGGRVVLEGSRSLLTRTAGVRARGGGGSCEPCLRRALLAGPSRA